MNMSPLKGDKTEAAFSISSEANMEQERAEVMSKELFKDGGLLEQVNVKLKEKGYEFQTLLAV